MRSLIILLSCGLITGILSGMGSPVVAQDAQFTNNKFGIHLAQPADEDINRAAELVNSSGGTWGYVTLVIHEDDKNVEKWQGIFDALRKQRLIPIIRLATQPDGDNWERPHSDDAAEWVVFLNKLHWVVKDRYIILFNEPNHGQEWGGSVEPIHFGKVNETFARALKSSNKDYFVMMGGMDLAAPSARPHYEDAAVFLRESITEIGVEDFNTYFDGLASHSYPNPGFIGSPLATGRMSVRGYQWELDFLASLGVKDLPVFITETGWNGDVIPRAQIAENFRYVFEHIWLPDERIIAVTPFILNYQGEPFLKFSWVKPGNDGVYPEFGMVKGIAKERGRPNVEQSGSINYQLPAAVVEQSTYHFRIELQNRGQAIWSKEDGYTLKIDNFPADQYLISSWGEVKPHEDKSIDVYLTTTNETGTQKVVFSLYRDEESILASKVWDVTIVPWPSLTVRTSLFPKMNTAGEDFEIQVFDQYEQLVFSEKNVNVEKGEGHIDKVENIALGEEYRVVLLKHNYLPRQTFISFTQDNNEATFDRMLPLDFNGDGALRWGDVPAFFQNMDQTALFLP